MVVRYVEKRAAEDSDVTFADIQVGEAFRDEDGDVAIKTSDIEALVVSSSHENPFIYSFVSGQPVEPVTLEIREVPE